MLQELATCYSEEELEPRVGRFLADCRVDGRFGFARPAVLLAFAAGLLSRSRKSFRLEARPFQLEAFEKEEGLSCSRIGPRKVNRGYPAHAIRFRRDCLVLLCARGLADEDTQVVATCPTSSRLQPSIVQRHGVMWRFGAGERLTCWNTIPMRFRTSLTLILRSLVPCPRR